MTKLFRILRGTQLIGNSDFEDSDPSMGIRMGRFMPEPGYLNLEPLQQELAIVSSEESQATNEPDKRRVLKARREQIWNEIAIVPLRVETNSGQAVRTAGVYIEDFAAELGDSERFVTLVVNDRLDYEKFWPES